MTSSSSSSPRRSRRRYRRNPRVGLRSTLKTLSDGIIGGAEVVVGKAAARGLPKLANLPQTGNMGLATQAAVGMLAAIVLPMVGVPRDHAAMIAAGAFSAPLETLAVAHSVPFLAPNLSPPAAIAAVQGYLIGDRGGMGRYVPSTPVMPMARRVSSGGVSTTPLQA